MDRGMQVGKYHTVLLLVCYGCIFAQLVDGEECFQNQCESALGTSNHLDSLEVLSAWRHTLGNSELCQDSLDSLELCKDWSDERMFGGDMFENNNEGSTFTGDCDDLGRFDSFGKVTVLEETECIQKKCLGSEIGEMEGYFRGGEIDGVCHITSFNGVKLKGYFKGAMQGGVWIEESKGKITGVGDICSGQSWRWVDYLHAAIFQSESNEIIMFANKPEIVFLNRDESFGRIVRSLQFICDGNGLLVPQLYSANSQEEKIKMLMPEMLERVTENEKHVYKIVKALNELDIKKRGITNIAQIGDEVWLRKHGETRDIPFQGQDLPDWESCMNLRTYAIPRGFLPLTALVSYPGSGNTWLRYLVEAATGVVTSAEFDGYQNLSSHWGTNILIKTHHVDFHRLVGGTERELLSWRMSNIRHFSGRAILITRNPLDAIRSWWNHEQVLLGEAVDQDVDSLQFMRFAEAEIIRWRDTAVDWILLSPQLLVVHYEELLSHPTLQVTRIKKFLEVKDDNLRNMCLAGSSFTAFKREKRSDVKIRINDRIKSNIKSAIFGSSETS